jgi:hypothetical protein
LSVVRSKKKEGKGPEIILKTLGEGETAE